MICLPLISCVRTIREEDLFHPRREPAAAWQGAVTPGTGPSGLAFRAVEIRMETGGPSTEPGANGSLRGWAVGPPGARRSAIYYYGNAETVLGSRPIVERFARDFDVEVLVIDVRGYGFSDGVPSLDALLADGLRMFDVYVADPARPPGPLFLYGHSLGSAAAVHVAASRPTAGLILEAPPTSAAEVVPTWRRHYPWFLRWAIRLEADAGLRARRPQPVERIRDVSAPLLVLHGDQDDVVPPEFGRRMFDAAPGPDKTWCPVPDTGHIHAPFHPAGADAIRRFLDRLTPR